jgi:hypothetical protein
MLEQQWELPPIGKINPAIDLQALYSFESPRGTNTGGQPSANRGIHRSGLSIKADLEIGLVMDALYSYNHEAQTELDGLSFSAGIDYSFFDGNLIVLAEYLYNGLASSTSTRGGGNFSNEHYLYTGFTWLFDDFTNAGLALISGFSDISFTPIVTFSRELFQGATLSLTAQIPLDRDLFTGNGNRGELGPIPPDHLQPLLVPEHGGTRMGRYFDSSVKLRLRF